MLVCWEWLAQYVRLDVTPDELAHRFAMSGLNHESTAQVGSDTVIDLEVTSNRGDCLGHIGVAREAAVLLGQSLKIPEPQLPESSQTSIASLLQVENLTSGHCPRYTARVIQGIKVGPSPSWLSRRLQAIGVKSINNVVDVTNYVMFECGQPLHAFDLDLIRNRRIVVRTAQDGEKFLAIDHRTYELDAQMVVIADADRAVALGGVMGGADTEVSTRTTNVLIEAAAFDPMSIRRTARKLKLHSPSSHRFERKPDSQVLDWASRRCCELILQVAGGSLVTGSLDKRASSPNLALGTEASSASVSSPTIAFRFAQIYRILGIEVARDRVEQILQALGCRIVASDSLSISILPPSWRPDLVREIDLIEEIARIYGYDQIPEDVSVPLTIAAPRAKDVVLARVRQVLSASGIDEALTPSIVTPSLDDCGSLWSDQPALATETPLLEGAKLLRRGLGPSLLAVRHTNQALSLRHAQLYECATIYLPRHPEQSLPQEQTIVGIVTEGDLAFAKGLVEEIVNQVCHRQAKLEYLLIEHSLLETGSGLQYKLDSQTLGFVGLVASSVRKRMGLEDPVAIAELSLDILVQNLHEVRQAQPISTYPAVTRDLNFILEEQIDWSTLHATCTSAGGQFLQAVVYRETYRDPKKDGPEKKRILVELQFQSFQRTLTSQEVEQAVTNILAQCSAQLRAKIVDQA